ncbi:MAG: HRDC domain-containing protein [Chloroflexi bacterium]|nr:HRDC domain-containing protein [Chloroflexota bacterium]
MTNRTLAAKIEDPVLVYNEKTFAQMMNHLSKQTLFALDTESDSLYRYYPRVCLIQISTFADAHQPDLNQIVDYLVDPLRLQDIGALGLLLADPSIEVVMHAAENDILELQRDLHYTFHNIFDTQLAARILGWPHVGLAAILEEQFGIISDKRMQRTNWGKRPLTPQQITYAQMDTHFLPTLRTILTDQLKTKGRWEEAQEAMTALSRLDYQANAHPKRSFWQMKTTREVPREATGLLEALWQWREQLAESENCPPFKILNDQTLSALAMQRPKMLSELQHIAGWSEHQRVRYGKALLDVIAEGQRRPLPALPEFKMRPEQALDKLALSRYDALRRWRSHVAETRGVALEIIFNNNTLLELAQHAPQTEAQILEIPEIGLWKAKTYGPDILRILHNKNS